MLKPPCTIDCPMRSADCRLTCPDWPPYEKMKMAEREARRKTAQENSDVRATQQVMINRHYRRKRHK